MKIGYFLQFFIKLDGNLHNKKIKLIKFKSGNTTNYTLKQDFKSEIIWIQYIVPCLILERIWQEYQK
jgi:hypothetical protein